MFVQAVHAVQEAYLYTLIVNLPLPLRVGSCANPLLIVIPARASPPSSPRLRLNYLRCFTGNLSSYCCTFAMSSSDKPPALLGGSSRSNPPYDPLSLGGASLPLLVRMPDGERHQVDVPPNTSIRDLKNTIANITSPTLNAAANNSQNLAWDLDFAGSVLNDNHTLDHYNIPDAYDHANGLLKTISDSGYLDPGKKVEALDKACAVVQSISRGERDMERLINAVFEQADDLPGLESPSAQPSLTAMRRSRRSRIPSLNFAHLPPIGAPPSTKGPKAGLPSAPTTPSELIRRMSSYRPDLYDPSVVAKATAQYNPSTSNSDAQPLQNSLLPTLNSSVPDINVPSSLPLTKNVPHSGHPTDQPAVGPVSSTMPAQFSNAPPSNSVPVRPSLPTDKVSDSVVPPEGSTQPNQNTGELKRGNTWFTEVISSLGNSVLDSGAVDSDDDDDDDVDGDSEGEGQVDENGAKIAGRDADKSKKGGNHSVDNVSQKASMLSADSVGTSGAISSVNMKGSSAVSGFSKGTDRTLIGATEENIGPDGSKDSQSDGALSKDLDDEGEAGASRMSKTPSTVSGVKSQAQVIGLEPEVTDHVPSEQMKIPKKRGRKRKNPHLSEEERKAQRQAQNRESAKLSRIRRKNLTMEYERRVNTLEGENENLRDTVAALTDRLEMLQNLLTISVQKRPMPSGTMEQFASAGQVAAVAAATTGRGMSISNIMGSAGMGVASLNNVNNMGQMGMGTGGDGQNMNFSSGSTAKMPPSTGVLPNLDFSNL